MRAEWEEEQLLTHNPDAWRFSTLEAARLRRAATIPFWSRWRAARSSNSEAQSARVNKNVHAHSRRTHRRSHAFQRSSL